MASRKILKAAVIGCGRIGALTVHKPGDDLPARYFPTNHCAAIKATQGLELIAVCDNDPAAAKAAEKIHGVKDSYADYKKMIREKSPDIISIATRMSGRDQIISFAAENGVKGMHIEKPIASNLSGTIKCLRAISENNVAVSYGTIRRYMPVYRQAKEIMLSGKFGKLEKVLINIPKSQLLWAHPHTVDLINYFTDNAKVEYVESSFKYPEKSVSKNKIDMDPVIDYGIIKCKNGIAGILEDRGGEHVILSCEKGEIIIQIGGKNLRTRNNYGKIKDVKIRHGKSGRCEAMAELRDSINHAKPTSLSAEIILTEQKILMALGLSGITGRKVKLAEVKNSFTITGKFNGLYP